MILPERTSVFLGRPVSVAEYDSHRKSVKFLLVIRGRGTASIADMHPGEYAQLTGPLGNAWIDLITAENSDKKPAALVGGGIGIAPLEALYAEFVSKNFSINLDFYAGFKTGFKNDEEKFGLLGKAVDGYPGSVQGQIIITTEDGKDGEKGLITDILDTKKYSFVCACGPQPMLQIITEKCRSTGTPCYLSLERYMACGAGACLGCIVKTHNGNKSCCADGPIFRAEDVIFDE